VTAALRLMQRALEAQNGLAPQPSVAHFLLTPEERERLSCSTVPEEVFVSDDPLDPALGVFIDPAVLRRMRPSLSDATGLDAYCVATEGVSHFVYLAHRAAEERQVSLLELELQAEVDKFVHLAGKLTEHERLFEQLFERYALRDGLDDESSARYHTASRAAARFCHKLLGCGARLERAREFFRQSLEGKLRLAIG
jgi:hypothetical protein